jgi:PAS domain S-box-containing protein
MSDTIDPIVVAQALGGEGVERATLRSFAARLSTRRSTRDRLPAAMLDGLEAVGEALVLSDPARGEIVYASPGAVSLLGRELVGVNPLDLLADESRAMARERLRLRAAGHEVPPRAEAVVICANGRPITLETGSVNLGAGEKTLTLTVLRDVERQHSAVQRLEVDEALLDALLETTNRILLVADEDGRICRANSAAAAHLGIAHDQVLGRTIAELRLFDEDATHRVSWTPKPAGPAGWVIWSGEDLTRPDHPVSPARPSEYGGVGGRGEIGRMVSSLSHDLREPARVAGGFAGLIADHYGELLDDRGRRMLEGIQTAAGQMDELLDGLSAYGRADCVPRSTTIDLGEMAAGVRRRLLAAPGPEGAQIEMGALPVLVADPSGLEQVLEHLFSNALKFHDGNPPQVRVQATRLVGAWQVDVSDTGIGIAPRDRERVFELFCRLHPRDAYPGTGAGLAICKRTVERHGGSIWIGDSPGGGATLCLTIPDQPSAP